MRNGFTLIELLVVIAIAGIFLSFMISTLGAGRQRAIDSKNQQALTLALAQAESYFASKGNFAWVCSDPTVIDAMKKADPTYGDIAGNDFSNGGLNYNSRCLTTDTTVGFTARSRVDSTKYLCVDNTGNSMVIDNSNNDSNARCNQ